MKLGDNCTYIARGGTESPGVVTAVNDDGTVRVSITRADNTVLDIGDREIVTEDDVVKAKDKQSKETDDKKKDDALANVRGKVHQKASQKQIR
jgi:hypothetical protein